MFSPREQALFLTFKLVGEASRQSVKLSSARR
jgi:hypothetical protein